LRYLLLLRLFPFLFASSIPLVHYRDLFNCIG
jgi:hypothetical protein